MSNQKPKHGKFYKYLGNSAWIMADSLVTNGFSLVVLAVVARFLGPEEYGAYAYVFSLASLFSMIGQMGLDGLLTRELIAKPNHHLETMGTAGGLRISGYILGALACLIYGFIVPDHSPIEKTLFICAAGFILLTPGPQLIENWFRSRTEARYAAQARMIGTVIGGAIKIGVVSAGLGVAWVGIAQVLTIAIILVAALFFFIRRGGPNPRQWIFSSARAKTLLNESWMIFLGSILTMVYLKVDQVMLRWWTGADAVGIYAVAARMSEVFYIIPAALVVTYFPPLIKFRETSTKRFNNRLQSLFTLLALLSYAVVLTLFVLAPLLTVPIFGEAYRDAIPVVMIHMLAMPFVFLRYAFNYWILIEKYALFSIVCQSTGAISNIILNLLLIPKYGMMGAAIATLISYCGAGYIVLLISPRTRPVFSMMTRALFKPWQTAHEIPTFLKGH